MPIPRLRAPGRARLCRPRGALEAGAISPSRYDSYARLYDKAKEIRLWETKQR